MRERNRRSARITVKWCDNRKHGVLACCTYHVHRLHVNVGKRSDSERRREGLWEVYGLLRGGFKKASGGGVVGVGHASGRCQGGFNKASGMYTRGFGNTSGGVGVLGQHRGGAGRRRVGVVGCGKAYGMIREGFVCASGRLAHKPTMVREQHCT